MNSYQKYNLDSHITGENDPNAPFNQPDSDHRTDCLEDAFILSLEQMNDAVFYELLSEVRKEVQHLRDYAKANENQYLLKRLNSIYQKL